MHTARCFTIPASRLVGKCHAAEKCHPFCFSLSVDAELLLCIPSSWRTHAERCSAWGLAWPSAKPAAWCHKMINATPSRTLQRCFMQHTHS